MVKVTVHNKGTIAKLIKHLNNKKMPKCQKNK